MHYARPDASSVLRRQRDIDEKGQTQRDESSDHRIWRHAPPQPLTLRIIPRHRRQSEQCAGRGKVPRL